MFQLALRFLSMLTSTSDLDPASGLSPAPPVSLHWTQFPCGTIGPFMVHPGSKRKSLNWSRDKVEGTEVREGVGVGAEAGAGVGV